MHPNVWLIFVWFVNRIRLAEAGSLQYNNKKMKKKKQNNLNTKNNKNRTPLIASQRTGTFNKYITRFVLGFFFFLFVLFFRLLSLSFAFVRLLDFHCFLCVSRCAQATDYYYSHQCGWFICFCCLLGWLFIWYFLFRVTIVPNDDTFCGGTHLTSRMHRILLQCILKWRRLETLHFHYFMCYFIWIGKKWRNEIGNAVFVTKT